MVDVPITPSVATASPGPCLIVNADDYGYYACVSRGILEAATRGIVTATAVFANAPRLPEFAGWLRDCAHLDTGIHLNLTYGEPLTKGMSARLGRWSGRFPGKFALGLAIVSGAIKPDHVRAEWRAQIERCLDLGLRIRFLNSHEHVHALPQLLAIAAELAHEFRIEHVRLPAGPLAWKSPTAFLRGAIVNAMGIGARVRVAGPAPQFLGLEVSGRLDVAYLQRTVPRLRPEGMYELMCHPGRLDASEVRDARLLDYHRWEGELRTLVDPSVRRLLDDHGVRLVRYRDLRVTSRGLAVSAPSA
jgi:predicted glycoside hydrolase/deacetylase ChbG (UPF0249 family)